MNKFEIDRYDYTVCPFNNSHRFSAEQYQYHILRCKDKHFPHLVNSVQQCPHNTSHYYSNPFILSYHIPRCPDYPGRLKYTSATFGSAPKEIEYVSCPYNPLHGIRAGEMSSFKQHIEDCPNKDNKIGHNTLPQPSLDKSISGQLNYKHGLISSEDISINLATVPVTKSRSNKLLIHYNDKSFSVYKSDINSGIEENDIWAGHITFADAREWPGLKLIEDTRSHSHYHVGNLFPDKSSGQSEVRFKSFVNMITVSKNNSFCIAVSAQAASDKNRAIFIAHRSEETGFGVCLPGNVELGVFYLPHSMLYNNESILKTQQIKLREKDSEIQDLQQRFQKLEKEKERIIEDWNTLKIEFEQIKSKEREAYSIYEAKLAEYEREKENLRTEVYFTLEAMKRDSEMEKIELNNQLEKVTNEKNSLQLNFFSETQNLKMAEKNNQERMNKMTIDLKAEYDKVCKELKEAQGLNRALREHNASLEQKLAEQRNWLVGSDSKRLIDEAVSDVRERISVEQQEKENCAICYLEKKNVVFMPCGHFVYCIACVKTLGIDVGKTIPKTSQHSRCSVCECLIAKALKAYPY